ncbi:hypothetical protein GCM10010243_66870 [Streptomyces matensis]|nr:hypothetical protein GCM10010243_66870 [Streptomyces matensis]
MTFLWLHAIDWRQVGSAAFDHRLCADACGSLEIRPDLAVGKGLTPLQPWCRSQKLTQRDGIAVDA